MKKKMLAAVLAGTMVMSLGTNLCWADGEKTKVTMTVWNGEWGDQLDRTMESFNSKHDDIELDITMQSGDYSDFLGTAAATNDWPDIYILTPWTQVQDFAEAGRIQDLSGMDFTEKVYPTALEAATYDGKSTDILQTLSILVYSTTSRCLRMPESKKFRKQEMKFEAACEKLEESGVTPIASTFKDSWTLKHMFSVMMSNVVQDDMEGFLDQLNSGEGTFNVDGIDDVFATADIIKAHCGSNMMDCDSTSGFNALANSEAAMLISGEFSQNVVAKMDNPPEIGYFALPVSNDAERNKAAVDVGIVYGVSTQTEHMDACKEVIDFLSDASLSDGYIAIVTEETRFCTGFPGFHS